MRRVKRTDLQFEPKRKTGQSAIEYLLLVAVVVAVVLVGMRNYLPRTYLAANTFMNATSRGIMGPPNDCGDGVCARFENNEKCCADCGGC